MFGWIFFLLFDVLEKIFLVNKEVLRVIDNELASSDRYTGQKNVCSNERLHKVEKDEKNKP